MGDSKKSILIIGPPHSGKSIFSYLLFKSMRKIGDDARLMDADYYSPTLDRGRMERFFSEDEREYILITPNSTKFTDIAEENFRKVAQGVHGMIDCNGFIIVDGLGRHSKSTECLLELCDNVILVCSNTYCIEEQSDECHYNLEGELLHPFNFYKGVSENCIKLITHLQDVQSAFFDQGELYGEVFDLDREYIDAGNIDRIPEPTKLIIDEIANYIYNNW